jgi:hypothetical protein
MMMLIMNSSSRGNWPVLKIEDSIKGSTNDLELSTGLGRSSSHLSSSQNLADTFDSIVMNGRGTEAILKPPIIQLDPTYRMDKGDQSQGSDIYIPNNVREALECAGINIEHIINLTSKLENTMSNGDGPALLDAASGEIEVEKRDHLNTGDGASVCCNKKMVGDGANSTVVSVSNKSLFVVQNISATNNFVVARRGEPDILCSKASESGEFSRDVSFDRLSLSFAIKFGRMSFAHN